MENALGLVAFIVYIAVIISVAAGVTWFVVRITPTKAPKPSAPESPS